MGTKFVHTIAYGGFMWLAIACLLGLGGALTHPFCSRLQVTGLWAGRALGSPGTETAMPTGMQHALTHGWPSTVILLDSLIPYVAGAVGFGHVWWAAPAVFFGTIVLFTLADRTPIASRALERYLAVFFGHITRRAADYAARGDAQRAEAANWLRSELETMLRIYVGSGVPVPSVEVARAAPFGDVAYLYRSAQDATSASAMPTRSNARDV